MNKIPQTVPFELTLGTYEPKKFYELKVLYD